MAHQINNPQPVNTAVVFGGINMDIWGRPDAPLVQKDSNPGTVTTVSYTHLTLPTKA